jgi:succinoglycan biosynthesis protein ExoU
MTQARAPLQDTERLPGSVAVIIAAYNAAAFIRRAIASALAQPEVQQVIVVDDASSDDTLRQAHDADDGTGRLLVVKSDKNGGPSIARNQALERCHTEWVCVLDADDFFLSGRIGKLLAVADDCDFIADDLWKVAEEDIDGPRTQLIGDMLSLPRRLTLAEFVVSNIPDASRPRAELGFLKPLMRRAFLQQHGLHYREEMRLGEDYELYCRTLSLGAIWNLVPPCGYVAVVRQNSISGSHGIADLKALLDCDSRLLKELSLSSDEQTAIYKHRLSTDARLKWRLLILAIKEKRPLKFILLFVGHPSTSLYLMSRLVEQTVIRGCRFFNANSSNSQG